MESETEKVQKEYEEHKTTDEYKRRIKYVEDKADDHYIRGDRDPEGFELYLSALKDQFTMFMPYI